MSFSSAFWLMRSFCRFPKCAYWFSKQTDKLEVVEIFRRERIYPFRPVTFS